MEIYQAVVSKTGKAEIHCPSCGLVVSKTVEDLRKKYRVEFTCSCNNTFIAEIEFRGKSRKLVDLPGSYSVPPQTSETKQLPPNQTISENCRIIDISRQGIGILITDQQQLTEGSTIKLDFHLDNNGTTRIIQECKVKHVNNNCVGCQIEKGNLDLDLYLLD
ncbi:MAG: PilZ domain-containing protein [Proteobacteria bacterium]|nr:PilZ domain-containing protein [Pseudomonadota bacterium]MBU1689017.1 PilZ domain-containing protein [Pseudomonadota bacterium]